MPRALRCVRDRSERAAGTSRRASRRSPTPSARSPPSRRRPSRRARREAREVGAGVGLREALAPDLAVEDRREVPPPLLVGARARAASTRRGGSTTNASDEARARRARPAPGRARSARRSTCRRPTPAASAAPRTRHACSSANHAFWNATNVVVVHAGLRGAPVARDVRPAPRRAPSARNSSSSSVVDAMLSATSTGAPRSSGGARRSPS